MPLSYLDSNYTDINAMGGLGESFARALTGLRRAQIQQMLEGQRIGIEQQYLRLAQEKGAREAQAFGEEQAARRTGRQALEQASENFGRLTLLDFGPGASVDKHLAQINFRRAMAQLAYVNPAVAGRALEPIPVGPETSLYDPTTLTRTIQGPGMSDYHRLMIQRAMAHDAATEAVASQRATDYSRGIDARIAYDQADLPFRLYRSQHPEIFAPDPERAALAEQIRGAGDSNIPTFDSEEAARKAGHKAGSVIRLKGVGKVRLN